MKSARHGAGSALVAAALVLSACSSSGGGSTPSQSQIESKLKSDSNVTALKGQLPSSAVSKFDAIISCIAKALKKDANPSDLKAYVDGKKKLENMSGNKSAAQTDVQNCVKTVVGAG